jgi:probable rRNA maturation factor
MSNLRQKKQQRLQGKRARQLTRLSIWWDWQIAPMTHFMAESIRRAANLAWQGQGRASVTVLLVAPEVSQSLNAEWRGKDYATNVLSFPFELPEGIEQSSVNLGDLVICPSVLVTESEAQGKTLSAHIAHIVVHGLLHLQGYDHETPAEAEAMEALEVKLLAQAGLSNPYR